MREEVAINFPSDNGLQDVHVLAEWRTSAPKK